MNAEVWKHLINKLFALAMVGLFIYGATEMAPVARDMMAEYRAMQKPRECKCKPSDACRCRGNRGQLGDVGDSSQPE